MDKDWEMDNIEQNVFGDIWPQQFLPMGEKSKRLFLGYETIFDGAVLLWMLGCFIKGPQIPQRSEVLPMNLVEQTCL